MTRSNSYVMLMILLHLSEKSIENSTYDELANVNDLLKINKLSLNINETKFMIFRNHQQQIITPNIFINYVNFNFLGIHFNQHLPWNPHITHISNLFTKSVGVLNKLKNIIPKSINKSKKNLNLYITHSFYIE